MKVLYVSVERRYQYYSGKYYIQGIEDIDFFARYLDAFDYVNVIARVEKVNEKPKGYKLFEHDFIKITPIFTAKTGIINLIQLIKLVKIIKKQNAFSILRTPGVFSYILSIYYKVYNNSYSLEVVTNPLQEAMSLTKINLINYFLSKIFISIFKKQLNKCNYASFVTNFEIQKSFLSPDEINTEKFNSSYSSIILDEYDFASTRLMKDRIRHYDSLDKINLLFIGVLDRPFKGLDIFINLLNILPKNYTAIIVGDGYLINEYKKMAQDLNLSERIIFKGYISDKQIKKKIMTSSDIFVLTSRREGLPRVVIEAMAWGLPCVCSEVSGVRELIDNDYIFPISNYTTAKKIICDLTPEHLINISNKNIQKAILYKDTFLKKRRFEFYQKVISSESSTFK